MNYLITTFIVAINGEQQTRTAGIETTADVYNPIIIKKQIIEYFRSEYPPPNTVGVVIIETIAVSEEHYHKTGLGRIVLEGE